MLKIQLWSQESIIFKQIFTLKKYILNCNNIWAFVLYFDQINAALVSRRNIKKNIIPNLWLVVYYHY